MKSFRTSPWDPKENLPQHYARIFQFMNFNKTKKRVMHEEVDDILSGQYVTLHIKDVPKSLIETLDAKILIISGLLKYENKISVLNFSVVKHSFCNDTIRSKVPPFSSVLTPNRTELCSTADSDVMNASQFIHRQEST